MQPKEGLVYLGFWSITVGKPPQQECETAGHMASAVRKQRVSNAGAQLGFFGFLFNLELPYYGAAPCLSKSFHVV